MALKHEVKDADVHFVVDPDSRKIVKGNTAKVLLMQYDHNSEEFTFDVPKQIETHDMSLCDVIQIHYENTSSGTSVSTRKTYRGVCVIDKDKINTEDENVISFSWLVPETATIFAGTLKFQLKFICYDNEDENIEGYKWHTDVNEDISIKAGLGYSENDFNPATTATLQSIEIVEIDGGLDIILDGVHHKLYNGSGAVPSNLETTDNKVTSIAENATDTQYPSAKAVRALFDSISGGSLPAISAGDTGKIIQVLNGAYVLRPINLSSVATYLDTIKSTSIDENSTDAQLASAKAVYKLVESYAMNSNPSIVEALNTDVEV